MAVYYLVERSYDHDTLLWNMPIMEPQSLKFSTSHRFRYSSQSRKELSV